MTESHYFVEEGKPIFTEVLPNNFELTYGDVKATSPTIFPPHCNPKTDGKQGLWLQHKDGTSYNIYCWRNKPTITDRERDAFIEFLNNR